MNKRKIILLATALCMVAILAVGGTLAFFTDTDEAVNTFSVGHVDITLVEEFDPENAELVPGKVNAVNKDVWVKNEGPNAAWIRVKIYIPSAVDQLTTPQYTEEGYLVAAAFNSVHMNTLPGVEEAWNVQKANVEAKAITEGEYAGYNEYIFYYNWIVNAGDTTAQLLDQVYMDQAIDYNNDTEEYFKVVNGEEVTVDLSNLNIIVVAEAIQDTGFTTWADAFAAFDKQINN